MPELHFPLRGDYVTLGQLLKLVGTVDSGGGAKMFLSDEVVLVNNEREQRRGRKLRLGDLVEAPGSPPVRVVASTSAESSIVNASKLEDVEGDL